MNRRELLAAAAAPLALALVPPAFARRRGGTALALVTADLEAAIVAVDLSNGEIHARLKTPAGPRSIESIGERAALVAHTEGGTAHAWSTRACASARSSVTSGRRATPPSLRAAGSRT